MSGEMKHRSGPLSQYGRLTPIWLVNRSIHNETRNIPFSSSNIFSFEDEYVLSEFLARTDPQQVEGMTHLWIVGDQQSAHAMKMLAPILGPPGGEMNAHWPITVYIPSRCHKLEAAANDTRGGATNITERLRAGWEYNSERLQVDGLQAIWERLAQRVVITEL